MKVYVRTVGLAVNGHRATLLEPTRLVPEEPHVLELPDSANGANVLYELGVGPRQWEMLLINGADGSLESTVSDGDHILVTGTFTGC